MYLSIFLTGLVFFLILLAMPQIVGSEVPQWFKMIFTIPGVFGFIAMIVGVLGLIWQL